MMDRHRVIKPAHVRTLTFCTALVVGGVALGAGVDATQTAVMVVALVMAGRGFGALLEPDRGADNPDEDPDNP